MNYISENHSKHLLMCHIIFVCKYRKKLLAYLGDYIKQDIQKISKHYGWQIIEQEVDQEYLSSHFWKEHTFWSDGYFSCGIGNVSQATIQKYIETQGS